MSNVIKVAAICFVVLLILQAGISILTSFSEEEGTRRLSKGLFSGNIITGLAVGSELKVELKNKLGVSLGFYDLENKKLKLGLENSSFNLIMDLVNLPESAVVYLDYVSDEKIATPVVSFEDLNVNNAMIILDRINPITSIMKCSSFDIGGFRCREWEKTNIRFIESDNSVNFEVNSAGTYAGFFNPNELKPEDVDVTVKNKFGNILTDSVVDDKMLSIDTNDTELNLSGVKSTKISVFIDTTENRTIKTPVVYIPNVNLDNAVVSLPKFGIVETIYKCEKFNLGGFNCLNWKKANVPFVDKGNEVSFKVDSFSAYAGGLLSAIVALNLDTTGIETRNVRRQSGGIMISPNPLQFKSNDEWIDISSYNNISYLNYTKLIIKPFYTIFVSNKTEQSLMQLKFKDTYINYALENALNVEAEVNNFDEHELLFKEIQRGVDLKYTLNTTGVKEYIILKELTSNKFRFILDTENVKFTEGENGSYEIYNLINKSLNAIMLKPYMYDAENKTSYDINVSLESENNDLILDLNVDYNWLENAKYPVVIDPVFSIRANSTNAFSCASNNGTIDCRPGTNVINMPNTSVAAVLDFNLSNLGISRRENISAVSLELVCGAGISFTADFINVTGVDAKRANETGNISGLHREVMGSNRGLIKGISFSCTGDPTNTTFTDTGTAEVRRVFRNNPANLRYFPIGINISSISSGAPAFNNELAAVPPVLYFNSSFLNNAPTQGKPVLNSTTLANTTAENLTLYNVSTSDANDDNVQSIVTWKKNNVTWYLLYYPFEDNRTAGGLMTDTFVYGDYSGNNRNGTAVNNSDDKPGQQPVFNATGVNHTWSNRTRSGALSFSGFGHIVRSTTTPDFNRTNFSIGVWFYNERDSAPAQTLISKRDVNADAGGNNNGLPVVTVKGWQILVNATLEKSCLDAGNRTSVLCFNNATTVVTTNATHYAVVTYNTDTGIAYIYLDGSAIGSAGNSTTINLDFTSVVDLGAGTFGPRNISIGAGYNFTSVGFDAEFRHFRGWIDEVVIYNDTLTSEEVRAIYGNGIATYNRILTQRLVANDVWHTIVTGNDNLTDSSGVTSNAVRIAAGGNNPPSITQPLILPSVIYTNTTTINITTNYSDPESDNGFVTFTLFVDNIKQNDSSVTGVISGANTSVSFGNNWNKTQNLTVQVNASDGTSLSGYINSSINVSNVIPSPGNVSISPPNVFNATTNFISFNVANITDSDSNDKINVTIIWFKNNIAIRNTTKTDQANNTNVTDILAQGNYTSGDNITVQYNVSEGGSQSHYINSTSVITGLSCGNINTAGVYTLDRNLNAFGSCFNITASNVEINCAGYYVNYSVSSLGYGVNISNAANVTVRNCFIGQNSTIVDNSFGILFRNATNITILNNTIETRSANTHAIRFLPSTGNNLTSIINNTIKTSGSSAYGIDLPNSEHNLIFNNSFLTNGSSADAIAIRHETGDGLSFNNTILNNSVIVRGNGRGILVGGGSAQSNRVENNTVKTFGGGAGIDINIAKYNLVNGNNVTASGNDAIIVGGGGTDGFNNGSFNIVWTNGSGASGLEIGNNGNSVWDNNIITTTGINSQGVYLTGGSAINITNNNITTTGGCDGGFCSYGIDVRGPVDTGINDYLAYNNITTSGVSAFGIVFTNNGLKTIAVGNLIKTTAVNDGPSPAHGIYIHDNTDNLITNNTINVTGANASGIVIRDNNNVIIENNITQAGKHGFFLDPTAYKDNNTIRNNTLSNIGGSELYFDNGNMNYTFLIDQPIRSYTFATNLIIVKNTSFGEINFTQGLTGSGSNLNADISIGNNSVTVRSDLNSGLNKTAYINLTGSPGSTLYSAVILRNGVKCDSTTNPICINLTILSGSSVYFNVTSFTNYSIGEGNIVPNLTRPIITPTSPTDVDTLNASSTVTDSDTNDKINVTITWFKNNAVVRTAQRADHANNTIASDTLTSGNFTGKDVILVQFNVSQGSSTSVYSNSTSVTITASSQAQREKVITTQPEEVIPVPKPEPKEEVVEEETVEEIETILDIGEQTDSQIGTISEVSAIESIVDLPLLVPSEDTGLSVSYKEGTVTIDLNERSVISFTPEDLNPEYQVSIINTAPILFLPAETSLTGLSVSVDNVENIFNEISDTEDVERLGEIIQEGAIVVEKELGKLAIQVNNQEGLFEVASTETTNAVEEAKLAQNNLVESEIKLENINSITETSAVSMVEIDETLGVVENRLVVLSDLAEQTENSVLESNDLIVDIDNLVSGIENYNDILPEWKGENKIVEIQSDIKKFEYELNLAVSELDEIKEEVKEEDINKTESLVNELKVSVGEKWEEKIKEIKPDEALLVSEIEKKIEFIGDAIKLIEDETKLSDLKMDVLKEEIIELFVNAKRSRINAKKLLEEVLLMQGKIDLKQLKDKMGEAKKQLTDVYVELDLKNNEFSALNNKNKLLKDDLMGLNEKSFLINILAGNAKDIVDKDVKKTNKLMSYALKLITKERRIVDKYAGILRKFEYIMAVGKLMEDKAKPLGMEIRLNKPEVKKIKLKATDYIGSNEINDLVLKKSGDAKLLGKGARITFNFNDKENSLLVKNINQDDVEIEVNLNKLTLTKNATKEIDLDSDNVNDVKVLLNNVFGGNADIEIFLINEIKPKVIGKNVNLDDLNKDLPRINRRISDETLSMIMENSREFIDSKLKKGVYGNVLVLFGKNYKMDLIDLKESSALLRLKDIDLSLILNEPVLVDLDKNKKYEALVVYKEFISEDIGQIMIRELPLELQKDMYRLPEDKIYVLEEQLGLIKEKETVFWSFVGSGGVNYFEIKNRPHKLMLNEINDDYVSLRIDGESYRVDIDEPKMFDLNKDNLIDTIVTFERFVNRETAQIRIEGIIKLDEKIDKKLLEYQESLPISTKVLYQSIFGKTQYKQKFVLGENQDHFFILTDINKDKIVLAIDEVNYVVNFGKPLRADVNDDGVLDVEINYDKYISDDVVKITINGITAFNKLTGFVVDNAEEKVKDNIFVFIMVLIVVFVLILFFRWTR